MDSRKIEEWGEMLHQKQPSFHDLVSKTLSGVSLVTVRCYDCLINGRMEIILRLCLIPRQSCALIPCSRKDDSDYGQSDVKRRFRRVV